MVKDIDGYLGKYKIMDYHERVLYEDTSESGAKKEFIRLAKIQCGEA